LVKYQSASRIPENIFIANCFLQKNDRRRAPDRRIGRVVVEDTPASFRAIVDEPLHRNTAEIVVPGVLRHNDIADLNKAIAPRPVTVLNHATSNMYTEAYTPPYTCYNT
jgi:hypothetical protein